MSNNSSEFCQKLSSRKASYNRKSSLMCTEAHNHRPSLEIEMKNDANLRRGKSSSLIVSHLFKTTTTTNNSRSRCKSDVGRCIHNIGCQMNNRAKPRLVNLTKRRHLSNAANILFEFLFLALLIFALITDESYISCNNMHKTIDNRQPMKLGFQKHETQPNPFLRALLTTASNQQFTHIQPNIGRSNINNNEFMPRKMPLNSNNNNNNNNNQLVNQMMANSQPLAHINHQNLGASESNSYNSITNLQDYPDNRGGQQNVNNNNNEQNNNPESNLGQNGLPPSAPPLAQNSAANHLVNDEPRSGFNDYQQNDQQMNSPFEPPPNSSSLRSSNNNGNLNQNQLNDQSTNSRSSNLDGYSRVVEQIKPRESSGGSTSGSHNPLRSSVGDPFEDLSSGGISTSEYERDLADLDEEFNRHTTSYSRRPTVSGPPIVSDSFMSLSPERYEARRYNRRPPPPPPPSYDYSGEYLNTAGSISSIVPRTYQRPPPPHWSTSYSDNTDLWTDSNVDFSPLSSYISPSQYSYRWRPRYQRFSAYPSATAAAHPYLTASASEQQHLHPGYNMIPTGYTSSPVPTETISIALSPLAAAAAAAASALAAADKSRHQNHHHWLTLPRITTTTSSATANPTPTTSASASNAHQSQAIPQNAFQTAYYHHHHHHRPNPYALSSMPIYAIAPRPSAPIGPSHPTGAAAAGASYIPYFHGGAPAIIAYRPTSVMPPASLLTAASFAYPLRLPVTTIPKAPTIGMTLSPTRGSSNAFRPFYSDLQYAESKSKTNLNNHNNNTNNNNNNNSNSSEGGNSGKGGGLVKGGTLTAMAKNLTRKMFGSSSQIRPQHVAPPSNLNNNSPTTTYDLFSPTHNSSSSSSSVGSALTI